LPTGGASKRAGSADFTLSEQSTLKVGSLHFYLDNNNVIGMYTNLIKFKSTKSQNSLKQTTCSVEKEDCDDDLLQL
jgi:hypothetical protein